MHRCSGAAVLNQYEYALNEVPTQEVKGPWQAWRMEGGGEAFCDGLLYHV